MGKIAGDMLKKGFYIPGMFLLVCDLVEKVSDCMDCADHVEPILVELYGDRVTCEECGSLYFEPLGCWGCGEESPGAFDVTYEPKADAGSEG